MPQTVTFPGWQESWLRALSKPAMGNWNPGLQMKPGAGGYHIAKGADEPTDHSSLQGVEPPAPRCSLLPWTSLFSIRAAGWG